MTGGVTPAALSVASPLQTRLFAGGSEGLAMLNRTNRTLSANLNRLNLGTRSFVLAAGEFNGLSTLPFRHAHESTMRVGMRWSDDPSIRPSSRIVIPAVPGSTPVVPRPPVVCVERPPVGDLDALPALTARTATAACFAGAGQGQPQAMSYQGRAEAGRKPLQGKRSGLGKAPQGAGIRAARDTAAARTAAAGG